MQREGDLVRVTVKVRDSVRVRVRVGVRVRVRVKVRVRVGLRHPVRWRSGWWPSSSAIALTAFKNPMAAAQFLATHSRPGVPPGVAVRTAQPGGIPGHNWSNAVRKAHPRLGRVRRGASAACALGTQRSRPVRTARAYRA